MSVDQQAIIRLKRGDPSGFDLAYGHYHRQVYGFLFRLSGRPDVADDLFQETWLRFARSGAALREDSSLKSWLFTVSRHLFVSRLRSEREALASRLPHDGGAAIEGGIASRAPVVGPDGSILLSELERALLALSVDDRELLLLVCLEGFGQNEVATMLGLEASAVRQRVTRARARLVALLYPEDES